ncbi:hypothetical protein IPG41_02415 [Candidatus Peregrinibacteria bacterium]|nr:MAG: hypothetical protein IPG41_02415 [Candidatus Peregrinibacteria bacterium]
MTNTEQLSKILRLIHAAEASLKSARELLGEISPETVTNEPRLQVSDAKSYDAGESQIVEGTFDGQGMIGPNDKNYPVPANYASKSKLVEGDRLKLTILPNGTFLYKQIAPIDREFLRGTLNREDGQYKVVANGKSYRVLLASVTYYKGNVGDEVTLIVPKNRESAWGTLEAVLPQSEGAEVSEADSF